MRTILVSACLLSMALISPIQAAMLQVDSLDFDYKYEMDVNPTTMSLDTNLAYDWDQMPSFKPSGKKSVSFANGIMTMPDVSCLASGHTASSQLWPAAGFSSSSGFTIEMSIKINSQTGADGATSFYVAPASGSSARFLFGTNTLSWYEGDEPTTLSTASNSDTFHTYRFAASDSKWWVWRDDVLLTDEAGIAGYNTSSDNKIYFGPAVASTAAGVSEVDYIRLDNDGAYAPVPEPSTIVLLLAGVLSIALIRRK